MLEIYKPTLEDLWFKKEMLEDISTMSYNHAYGGIILFHKSKWETWYKKWMGDESKRYYRYLKYDDIFVGEISYHYDEQRNIYLCDVLIYDKYRHNGYGKLGLKMICDIAKSNNIKELYDDIAIDNPSINLFISEGFIEVSRSDESVLVKKILI